jgi:sialate O-acetylesterase
MGWGLHRIAWIVLAIAVAANAEVRLPNILSDHAVLQRGQPVRVWGWAAPGEQVTVQFHDQQRKDTANAIGAWEIWLMPESAGGPYVLSVRGSQTEKPLERSDILVGDVWVASGQSNMEFPLKGFPNAKLQDGDKEIANANHPRIRLLLVKRAVSLWPLGDINGAWSACTPATAENFSAVAYFFGRKISERENVPIGLIDSTWGGTPAQSWISFEGLGVNDLSEVLSDAGTEMRGQALANETRDNFAAQNTALKTQNKPALTPPRISNYQGAKAPAVLFNGMIAPLTRYTIKGVIWYQGETDSAPQRAPNYARMFSSLITDWRGQWGEGDFPFLFVQISSFTSHKEIWGQVRDAQRRVLALRNTGMAVSLDVGDPTNVHPADKQTVGARLAFSALGSAYGEAGNYAAPEFLETTVEEGAMRLWLLHAEGLTARDKKLGDFELAGDDHNFKPADAKIDTVNKQATIVVSSADVPHPRYVRYGWSNVVTHYLYNSAGLPLSTFTTE